MWGPAVRLVDVVCVFLSVDCVNLFVSGIEVYVVCALLVLHLHSEALLVAKLILKGDVFVDVVGEFTLIFF